MRKKMWLFTSWILCFGLIIPLAAQPASDISGIWAGKAGLNDGGTDSLTVTLKKDGKKYAGTIVDELGLAPEGTALKDVILQGNNLKLSFQAKENIEILDIKVSLTISGDTMTGRWEDAVHGTGGSVELARKK